MNHAMARFEKWLLPVSAAMALLVLLVAQFFVPVNWTAVSAIGGALGAGAAWRAAAASERTGENALRAVALTVRPQLVIRLAKALGGGAVVWVWNTSKWAAQDVRIEVRLRDGRVVRDSVTRIVPASEGGCATRCTRYDVDREGSRRVRAGPGGREDH